MRVAWHVLYAKKPSSSIEALKLLARANGGKISSDDAVKLITAAIRDRDPSAIKLIANLADMIPMKALDQAMKFLEDRNLVKRPVPALGKDFSKIEKKHLYIDEIRRIKIPHKEESP